MALAGISHDPSGKQSYVIGRRPVSTECRLVSVEEQSAKWFHSCGLVFCEVWINAVQSHTAHLGFNFLPLHFAFHISFSCPVEHLQLMHNEDDDDNEGNTSQNDL